MEAVTMRLQRLALAQGVMPGYSTILSGSFVPDSIISKADHGKLFQAYLQHKFMVSLPFQGMTPA